MIKFVSIMALFLGFAAQAQERIDVLYNNTAGLAHCGGTIDTKCSNSYSDRCWINVRNSNCNSIRLYDDATYNYQKNRVDFTPGAQSKTITLSPIGNYGGVYSTGYQQVYALKSKMALSAWKLFSFRQNKYYINVFVSNNGQRPYDRVVLWFKNAF